MARTLPNSKVNREKIDPDTAYNRAVNRGEFLTHVALDPQTAEQVSKIHPDRVTADKAGS